MLTVNNMLPSGEEIIYETAVANFVPVRATGNQVEGAMDTLWIERDDGGRMPLVDGDVFVMNDKGATVARYILRWPGPSVDSETSQAGSHSVEAATAA